MNIYNQLNEWFKNYEDIGSWLYFNSTPVELGVTSMLTNSNSYSIRKFIDGSKSVSITVTINMIKSYDEGTSDINLTELEEVDKFCNWITHQNEIDNYPELGDNITVTEIKVLNNVPILSVNEASQLAQYSFNAQITYLDESEVINNG